VHDLEGRRPGMHRLCLALQPAVPMTGAMRVIGPVAAEPAGADNHVEPLTW